MAPTKKEQEALKNAPSFNDQQEIKELIEIWKDKFEVLESVQAKDPIYAEIADLLHRRREGFPKRSHYQIKKKITYLRDQYQRYKPKKSDSGKSPDDIKWLYFKEVHEILGSRPYYNETLASTSESGFSGSTSESGFSGSTREASEKARKRQHEEEDTCDSSGSESAMPSDVDGDETLADTPHTTRARRTYRLKSLLEKQEELLSVQRQEVAQATELQQKMLTYMENAGNLMRSAIESQQTMAQLLSNLCQSVQTGQNSAIPPFQPSVGAVIMPQFQSGVPSGNAVPFFQSAAGAANTAVPHLYSLLGSLPVQPRPSGSGSQANLRTMAEGRVIRVLSPPTKPKSAMLINRKKQN